MPATHTIGDRYWHFIRLQKTAPRKHYWPTFEYEWPYRRSQATIVRLVGKLGIAYGRWEAETMEPDEAAFNATNGRVERPDVVGEGGTTIEEQRELTYQHTLPRMDEIRRREGTLFDVPQGWTVVLATDPIENFKFVHEVQ